MHTTLLLFKVLERSSNDISLLSIQKDNNNADEHGEKVCWQYSLKK